MAFVRHRFVHALLTIALAICCLGQDVAKPTVGSVSGALVDSVTGAPISRVTVTLTPVDMRPATQNPPPFAATVTTLPDGTFVADDLQPVSAPVDKGLADAVSQ
jgi:hypothetical protein